MKWMKLALTCAITVMIIMFFIEPASAVVSKSGSRSCPTGQYVQLYGKGTGVMRFYWPTTNLQKTVDHGDYEYTSSVNTHRGSTSWKITVTGGYLNDVGTYSKCA